MRWSSSLARTKIRRVSQAGLTLAWTALFAMLAVHRAVAATRATGVGFEGLQATVAIGLGIPHATAIDAAGNIYVTDLIDSKVLKLARGSDGVNCTVSGGCTAVGSGFSQPTGVAIDGSGDVFVTDASTGCLYKVTSAGAQTTVATGLAGASGVALGADGTAYVAVAGAIKRVTTAGVVSTFASGPAQPGGIALSATGSLYLADIGGNRILQFTSSGAQTTLASGLNAPASVALDGASDVYIADTGNNRILSVSATGTGFVCPADCALLALSVSAPSGAGVDASGNLYIADAGDQRLVRLAGDADFGAAPVASGGASSATHAVSLTLNYLLYGSSCASPPTVSVLTRGAAGKDFTSSAAANVCTPGSGPGSGTPDALAVTVNFAPLSPGVRTGSVQFVDATGVPQVATYLHGVGKGPEITWTPGVVAAAMTSP